MPSINGRALRPLKGPLKRLYRSLVKIEDTNGSIVQKQNKNEPKRKKRKGQQHTGGSRYIGVSRNGNKWQALLQLGDRKRYLGTLESEEETARLHDRNALLYHGIKKVSSKR